MQSVLIFFTNEPNSTLHDRFVCTLKDGRYFDVIVVFFRTSCFFRLYKSFKTIEKIRILVGLNVDSKTYRYTDVGDVWKFHFLFPSFC